MISLSQMREGSGRWPCAVRQGRLRRWRPYQASSSAALGWCGGRDAFDRIAGMKDGDRERETRRVVAALSNGERRSGLRPAGEAALRVAAPIVARGGGG